MKYAKCKSLDFSASHVVRITARFTISLTLLL